MPGIAVCKLEYAKLVEMPRSAYVMTERESIARVQFKVYIYSMGVKSFNVHVAQSIEH